MRVALIGPQQSGKSVLFAAIAEAGGSHIDVSRPDQDHLAVVKVPEERLDWLSRQHQSKKTTPTELEFLDVPGFDLADEPGRHHAKTHWPAVRQSDMLVLVVREFEDRTVAAYRGRIDPKGDVEELLAEMLFSDLERVTNRIEKLEHALTKPTPERHEQEYELKLMQRLAEALETNKAISSAIGSEADDKLVRSFAFLTQKPALVVLNCNEQAASAPGLDELAGRACLKLSAKIEEELAQLSVEERGEFLDEMGLPAPARDRLIRACYEHLKLIAFFTVCPKESRAWAIPVGTDAITAAGLVHTDIARGFIRAETVAYDDVKAAGSEKDAKAAGKIRLEGKNYIIQDGDIIYFRFNV